MNLIDFLETLALAGACALIAIVYRYILLAEPVLNWWLTFGERFSNRWFYNPVWGCHKCISGQLALWLYLIWKISPFKQFCFLNDQIHRPIGWTLTGQLFCICTAIILSNILKDKFEKWI